ncbi:hypothetical protein BHM03_00042078, partial [Ensete ventricosum]
YYADAYRSHWSRPSLARSSSDGCTSPYSCPSPFRPKHIQKVGRYRHLRSPYSNDLFLGSSDGSPASTSIYSRAPFTAFVGTRVTTVLPPIV